MKYGRRFLALTTVVLLLSVACGGGEEVGEAFEGFEGGEGSGDRIGQIQVTPPPTPEPTAAPADPTDPPEQPAEQQPQEEEQSQEQEPAAVVEITGSGYDPSVVRMFAGTKLEVRNTDSQERSYTAANRSFDSGMIPPGGSWSFVPQQPGKFDVEDKTRPYVVGSLEVLAQ